MNFIDLKAQYLEIQDDVLAGIRKVLESGQYILGPEVRELEQKLAQYVGTEYCLGLSSGTDALVVALMALDIGPGDEVITTAFSFIATGEAIALVGAKPVFVDIDPKSYNVTAETIAPAITPRTKAIMPVSLYGQCADYDAINDLAAEHGLTVIEDAAQSFGATYKGRQSCGLTTIGCTSFSPPNPWDATAMAARFSPTMRPWTSSCGRSTCTARIAAIITPGWASTADWIRSKPPCCSPSCLTLRMRS